MASSIVDNLTDLPEDLSNLIYISDPRENGSSMSGKSARVGWRSMEQVQLFQTPRVYVPFGSDVFKAEGSSYEKITVLLQLKSELKGTLEFIRLCTAMDRAVIKKAFENQDLFFGTARGDYKSYEIIEDRYHKLLQKRQDYDPQVKLKIMENQTRIYDKKSGNTRVDGHMIPEKIYGRAIVQFGPVWVIGNKFGLVARCEQFLIIDEANSMKRVRDDFLFKDEDDDEDNEGGVKQPKQAEPAANDNGPYEPFTT